MNDQNTAAQSTPTSWAMEVLVQGTWSGNAVRFATEEEAKHAGKELLGRWFVPDDSRAVPSKDPVNYRFNMETYRPEPLQIKQSGFVDGNIRPAAKGIDLTA